MLFPANFASTTRVVPAPTIAAAAAACWIGKPEQWHCLIFPYNGCETLLRGSSGCLRHYQQCWWWQGLPVTRTQRGEHVRRWLARRSTWELESLAVKGKVTKRAMHAIKNIRSLQLDESRNGALFLALDRWVKGMNPKRKDFLDVLKEFRESEEDKEVWLKLMEWSFQQEWFEADVRDYTKLLKGYGREGRMKDVEELLNSMESKGIMPTVVTYTVLIGLYCKQRNVEKAKDFLEELTGLGLEPDVRSYNSLLLGYAHAAMLEEAKSLLEEMEVNKIPPNVDSYTALINAHGRLGQVDQAQRYFDLMQFKGVRPNAKAFTALLDGYGRALEPHAAREVFNNFIKVGFTADDRVIVLMLAAYERKDMLEEAISLVAELEKVKIVPGVESWTLLIGWLVRLGMVDEAGHVIEDLSKSNSISYREFCDTYTFFKEASQKEPTAEVVQA